MWRYPFCFWILSSFLSMLRLAYEASKCDWILQKQLLELKAIYLFPTSFWRVSNLIQIFFWQRHILMIAPLAEATSAVLCYYIASFSWQRRFKIQSGEMIRICITHGRNKEGHLIQYDSVQHIELHTLLVMIIMPFHVQNQQTPNPNFVQL